MSSEGYIPDNFPVVYDESEDQLYYTKNGKQPLNIGGGVTIYTGDGSLSGDRTIQLDGKKFSVINEDYPTPFLLIDPTEDAMSSILGSVSDFGDGIYSAFQSTINITDSTISAVRAFIGAEITNGKSGFVSVNLTDTTSENIYEADTHTFNGDIINADLAGGGVTGASIDDTGKLIRTP